MIRALLLVWFAILAGCRPAPVCDGHADCPNLQACIEGQCVEVECLASNQCEIQQYCEREEDEYTCVSGCEFSSDCYTTDRCDVTTHSCVERQCTDTQRDCGAGERCDHATNECYVDPAPHCQPCSSSSQCGEGGNCWRLSENSGAYCFLQCNPEAVENCPAGFQCTLVGEVNYACVAFCPLIQ